MKTDLDLLFLQHCDNDDLRTLCDILTHDNKGRVRLNEQLMNKDSYIASYPDNMTGMWQDLASELQRFGGNTFLNLFRHGHGPSYESIVEDVCRSLKVPFSEHDTAEEMETNILLTLTEQMLNKMSQEELDCMTSELNLQKFVLQKQVRVGAILLVAKLNKELFIKIFNYVFRKVSEKLIGRCVFQISGQLGARGLGLYLGPIAWILLSAWTVWDVAGPAYRVTIPAVIQIAYMRSKLDAQTPNAESNAC